MAKSKWISSLENLEQPKQPTNEYDRGQYGNNKINDTSYNPNYWVGQLDRLESDNKPKQENYYQHKDIETSTSNLLKNGLDVPKPDEQNTKGKKWYEQLFDPISSLQYGLARGIKNVVDDNKDTGFFKGFGEGVSSGFDADGSEKQNRTSFKEVLDTMLNSSSDTKQKTGAKITNSLSQENGHFLSDLLGVFGLSKNTKTVWNGKIQEDNARMREAEANANDVNKAKGNTQLAGLLGDMALDPANLIGGLGGVEKILSKGSGVIKMSDKLGDVKKATEILNGFGNTEDVAKEASYLVDKTAKKLGYMNDYKGVTIAGKTVITPEVIGKVADSALGKVLQPIIGAPRNMMKAVTDTKLAQDVASKLGGAYHEFYSIAKANPEKAMATMAYVDNMKKLLNEEKISKIKIIGKVVDSEPVMKAYDEEIARLQEIGDTYKTVTEITKLPNEERAALYAKEREKITNQLQGYTDKLDELKMQIDSAKDLQSKLILTDKMNKLEDIKNTQESIVKMSDAQLESTVGKAESEVIPKEVVKEPHMVRMSGSTQNGVKKERIEYSDGRVEEKTSNTLINKPKEEVKPVEVSDKRTVKKELEKLRKEHDTLIGKSNINYTKVDEVKVKIKEAEDKLKAFDKPKVEETKKVLTQAEKDKLLPVTGETEVIKPSVDNKLNDTYKELNDKKLTDLTDKTYNDLVEKHKSLNLPFDEQTMYRYKGMSEKDARKEIGFLNQKEAKRERLKKTHIVYDKSKPVNMKKYEDLSDEEYFKKFLSQETGKPFSKISTKERAGIVTKEDFDKRFKGYMENEKMNNVAKRKHKYEQTNVIDYIKNLSEKAGVEPRFDIEANDFLTSNQGFRNLEKARYERMLGDTGMKKYSTFGKSGDVTIEMAKSLSNGLEKAYKDVKWIKGDIDNITKDIQHLTKKEYDSVWNSVKSANNKPAEAKMYEQIRVGNPDKIGKTIQQQIGEQIRAKIHGMSLDEVRTEVIKQRKYLSQDVLDSRRVVRELNKKQLEEEMNANALEFLSHQKNKYDGFANDGYTTSLGLDRNKFNEGEEAKRYSQEVEGLMAGQRTTNKGLATGLQVGETPNVENLQDNYFEHVKKLIDDGSSELDNVSDTMVQGIIERDLNKIEDDKDFKIANEEFYSARNKSIPMTDKQLNAINYIVGDIKNNRKEVYDIVKKEFNGSFRNIKTRADAQKFFKALEQTSKDFGNEVITPLKEARYRKELLDLNDTLLNDSVDKEVIDKAKKMNNLLSEGKIKSYNQYNAIKDKLKEQVAGIKVNAVTDEETMNKLVKEFEDKALKDKKVIPFEEIKKVKKEAIQAVQVTPKEVLVNQAKTVEQKVAVDSFKDTVDVVGNAYKEFGGEIKNLEGKIKTLGDTLGDDKLFDEYMAKKYGDMPEFIEMKKEIRTKVSGAFDSLPDEVKSIAEDFRNDFKKYGIDEGVITKEEADKMYTYVAHMISPENKTKIPFEDIKLELKNPQNKHALNREVFGNMKIEEINKFMLEKHGVEHYMETRMSYIYLKRSLEHNKFIFDKKNTDTFMKTFGNGFDLHIKPNKGDKVGWQKWFENKASFDRMVDSGEYTIVKLDDKYKAVSPTVIEGDGLEAVANHNINVSPTVEIDPRDIKAKDFFEKNKQTIFLVPKDAHKQYINVMKAQYAEQAGALEKVANGFMTAWKAQALLGLGYHTNNMIGNVFNSYLSVGTKIFNPARNADAIKVYSAYKGVELSKDSVVLGKKASEWVDILGKYGIFEGTQTKTDLSSFLTGEAKSINIKNTPLSKLMNSGAKYLNPFKTSKEVGEAIENQARLTNFFIHVSEGKSIQEAVDLTNKFLFDYADTSKFENGVMKNIMPFYTWFRKNLPLQAEQLLKQPTKYGRVYRAKNDLSKPETEDQKTYKPSYLEDAIHMGKGKYVNINLPYDDLGKAIKPVLNGDAKDLVSSLNPIAKLAVELYTNKNLYYGSDIEKYKGELTKAPKLMKLLAKNTPNGKMIGVKEKYAIESLLPTLKNVSNTAEGKSTSFAQGIKVYEPKTEQEKTNALYNYVKKLQEAEKKYKNEGYIRK